MLLAGPDDESTFDTWPGGTVYGTLLNFKAVIASYGGALAQPPYKQPPRAPVLYIKPANTWSGNGAPVRVPADADALEMGGTLGIVFARAASRVSEQDALDYVLGYTIVNDVSIPHASIYRPAIRQKCRDGFCPIGSSVVARRHVPDPGLLELRIFVNDELKCSASTAEVVRPVGRLIADVTEFLTLNAGDLLMIGAPACCPIARAGDRVRVEVEGIGKLENTLIPEGSR